MTNVLQPLFLEEGELVLGVGKWQYSHHCHRSWRKPNNTMQVTNRNVPYKGSVLVSETAVLFHAGET